MPSDQELMARILNRDANAFESLMARHDEAIRRHLVRMVRDEAAALDLLQETFLRVWTRAEQWDGRGAFKSWLYRIATNLALNHLRSLRRRREQPLDVVDPWADDEDDSPTPAWMVDASGLEPEAVVDLAEQWSGYRRLVQRLPGEKRQVFRLVHEMEMSVRDTADELGIPEGTVKSRLHYARKRLREWQAQETEWEDS